MKKFLALIYFSLIAAANLLPLNLSYAAAGTNLILNPSVETAGASGGPANWTADKWGTNTTTMTYQSGGHSGSKSLYINMTAHTSGDAKWIPDAAGVTGSDSYTYTDYYQSNTATELDALYTDASGNGSYAYISTLPASSSWKQASATFTAPATAVKVQILHILYSAGTLQTDDFSLVDNSGAPAPTPPAVSITSPASNKTVSGSQTVSANASDSQGISSVQFKLDGSNLGSAITASPYNYTWDTSAVANGSHTLTAVATDTAGLSTTSAGVTVDVENQVPVPAPGTNLILNPSVETAGASGGPANWTADKWGTNTTTMTYQSGGHSGSKSLYINMTAHTSGDAKWIPDAAGVTGGQTYTYSDYYKSNVATEIDAEYTDSSGAVSYTYLGSAGASPTSWQLATATFTVPSSAVKVTILHIVYAVGWLQTDDFSLAQPNVSPPPQSGNLISNGSAETPSAANPQLPQDWNTSGWGTNTAAYSYVSGDGYSGSRSLKVTLSQYTSGDAKWYFTPVPVAQDTLYKFTDYYKSSTSSNVVLAFDMSDGSVFYSQMASLLPAAGWTQYTDEFSIPSGAKDVTVYHLIQSVGWLQTDDYSLSVYTPVGFQRALVSLTFDDALASTYNNGLPILQKYGFDSTDYIITGNLGQPGSMTTDMVKNLYADGNEIGSHTVTHPDLNSLSQSQVDQELSQSQAYLEQLLGVPVTDFAAPFGNINDNVLTEVKKYYASQRGVEPGFNSKDTFDIYHLKVQDVDVNTTQAEYTDWINQAISTKTWLIFVYHAVDPDTASAGQYDVTPTQLDGQLSALKSSGVAVVTVSQAIQEIQPQL